MSYEQTTETLTNGSVGGVGDPQEERRARAVVVAGMHRSGTSAFTRVLNLLGLDLPRNLYDAREDNPLGYWEPEAVVAAHEEFLSSIGSSFDDVLPISEPARTSDRAKTFEARLVEILRAEFGESASFVVKDPRICRLVPLWVAALEAFGATPSFVLSMRNPLEVTASLKQRNGFSTTKGLVMWLRHVLESERDTRLYPRSFVSYEDLLRDWRLCVRRMSADLSLVWPRASHAADAEIEAFLSPQRRHHSFQTAELEARPDVVAWVKVVYDVVREAAAGGELQMDVLDEVQSELDRADLVYGPLLAESQVARVALEREIAEHEQVLADRSAALEQRTEELAELVESVAEKDEVLAGLESRLSHADDELSRHAAAREAREREFERLSDEVGRLAEELGAVQQRHSELEAELAERAAEVDRLVEEAGRRDESLAAERESQAQGIAAHTAALEVLRADQRRLAETLAASELAFSERESELAAAHAHAEAREEHLEQARAELEQARGEREQATGELERTRGELEQAGVERERAKADLEQAKGELERAVRELEHTKGERDQARGEREQAGAELEQARAELEERVGATQASLDEVARLDAAAQDLRNSLARTTRLAQDREQEVVDLKRSLDGTAQHVQAQEQRLAEQEQRLAEHVHRIAEQEEQIGELTRRRWFGRRGPSTPSADKPERPSVPPRAAETKKAAKPAAKRQGSRWRATSQYASWILKPSRRNLRYASTYRELRGSPHFDAVWYLLQYPDVAEAGLNPLMHYIAHGADEGRNPSPLFNTARYRAELDSDADDVNPLLHHVRSKNDRAQQQTTDVPRPPVVEHVTPVVGEPEPEPEPEPVPPAQPEPPRPAVEPQATVRESPPAAPEPAVRAATAVATAAATTAATPRVSSPEVQQAEQSPTDCSDFTILLARQRSGTNPLRSILQTHPEIFCFNEVFNFGDRDSEDDFLRETNFFTFIQRRAEDDPRWLFPDRHEQLFLDFLEHLRCISPAPNMIIDVKYNTTHFLTKPWAESVGAPYLFELLQRHSIRVLNLTRRNHLRAVISAEKAWHTGRYTVSDGEEPYSDLVRWLDEPFLLAELERYAEEDALIERQLAGYDRYRARDYTEVFPDGNGVSPAVLDEIAAWLGVENEFRPEQEYRKQSTLPLPETIRNFGRVRTALRGTQYAPFLLDEPAYRTRPPIFEPDGSLNAEVLADADAVIKELMGARPGWIEGSISNEDLQFLFWAVLESGHEFVVEVGTASGFSTAVICRALALGAKHGLIRQNFQVITHDLNPHVYFDPSRPVGDAAREVLPDGLIDHVSFCAPSIAMNLRDLHGRDELDFLFIDANHRHPWPALDLLVTLDCLRPGGQVVFHDINLPLLHPDPKGAWGVKYLFDALDLEKDVDPIWDPPNIGRIRIPEDKEALRVDIRRVVDDHAWEVEVPEDVVTAALGAR